MTKSGFFTQVLWLPMARRKKRKKTAPSTPKPGAKQDPFNPVASNPREIKRRLQQPVAKVSSSRPIGAHKDEVVPTDDEIFLQAVGEVEPLKDNKKKIVRHPDPTIKPAHPAPNDELEAMTHLWELVHGIGDMDITFSDEYIEGAVRGFDRKLMRRLRRGEFPVQDYLDLHGLTKKDAEVEIRNFLMRSHAMGLRCVLVIHGRGLNSEDHIPILKERIPIWLSRGPVRKFVLAFSTARPYDGGTGAIYVLLRRRKGRPYLQV
ncbi:MAG: DNA mismatch repair protein MutS [Deltaproteobacteria bacterium]|nr:MAG: DNA mismatch repair protein MutS [Deltaproteobacteria bacterium]